MKIIEKSEPRVIMSNPHSHHSYFGWPTVARLKDGKLAVAASGFRLGHVCPFGKTVVSFSYDEGESYTLPAPVIDTPLDDRDGGVTPFGKNGVIVTSFNNSAKFQREEGEGGALRDAYLDRLTPEEEEKYLGADFRVSLDGGITFGERIYKSPVTSPHGPLETSDGRLIWVGRTYSPDDSQRVEDCIRAYEIDPDGFSMTCLGEIENILCEGMRPLSCEPHTVELPSGRLLTHIRVQNKSPKLFTTYQSISDDGGRSWSQPRPILPELGGAPSHILRHSSGVLVATYGHREEPYGIRAMLSRDGGESWDTGYVLFTGVSKDLGYPSTVELGDGSMITVFYAKEQADGPAKIMQVKWRFEDEI